MEDRGVTKRFCADGGAHGWVGPSSTYRFNLIRKNLDETSDNRPRFIVDTVFKYALNIPLVLFPLCRASSSSINLMSFSLSLSFFLLHAHSLIHAIYGAFK